MSKRAKPTAQVVYLLEEVLPYEGSETIGIFASPELAMKDRRGTWTEVRNDGERYWTNQPLDWRLNRPLEPYLHLTEWNVRA